MIVHYLINIHETEMNFSHFVLSTIHMQMHGELWCVNYVIYMIGILMCRLVIEFSGIVAVL